MNFTPVNLAISVFYLIWCAVTFYVMTPEKGEQRDYMSFVVIIFGALIGVLAESTTDLMWCALGFFVAGVYVFFQDAVQDKKKNPKSKLDIGFIFVGSSSASGAVATPWAFAQLIRGLLQ